MAQPTTVKKVKNGDWIQLINKDGSLQKKHWIRQDYDRSTEKYTLQNYDDINDYRYVKGSTPCVLSDF